MIKKIAIKKYFLQYRDLDGENQRVGCGASALAVVLVYLGHKVTAKELFDLGKKFGGLIDGIGWKHTTLCSLAQRFGVPAYAQSFEKYTEEGSVLFEEGINKIKESVDKDTPVMVSFKNTGRDGSHILVVSGYTENSFIIIDSEKDKEEEIEISYDEFIKRWRKLSIFFV